MVPVSGFLQPTWEMLIEFLVSSLDIAVLGIWRINQWMRVFSSQINKILKSSWKAQEKIQNYHARLQGVIETQGIESGI